MISQEFISKKISEARELEKTYKVKCEESFTRLSSIVPNWYQHNNRFVIVLSCDKTIFSSYLDGTIIENRYKIFTKDGKTKGSVRTGTIADGTDDGAGSYKPTEITIDDFYVYKKSGLEQSAPSKANYPDLSYGNVACGILIGYLDRGNRTKFNPIVDADNGGKIYHTTPWQPFYSNYTSVDSSENFRREIAPAIVDLDTCLRIRYDNLVDIAWLESLSERLSQSVITDSTNWQPCKYFQTLYSSEEWNNAIDVNSTNSLITYLSSVEREGQGSNLFSPVDVQQDIIAQQEAEGIDQPTLNVSSQTQNILRKYIIVWIFIGLTILYLLIKKLKK